LVHLLRLRGDRMKKGFQIEIQKDLSEEEKVVAIKFANEWTKDIIDNDLSWKDRTRGGWRSLYKRGVVGFRLRDNSELYFRRASRSRRIFQIVRGKDLKIEPQEMKYGGTFDGGLDGCMCPGHLGGLKVSTKYGDIETEVYCTVGNIKG